jgi:hypothetical protein
MMFYFVDESSLCVLCMDRTRSKITNDLIIFTTPILAERLYELNSWDRRTLRLHALKMGLRYVISLLKDNSNNIETGTDN